MGRKWIHSASVELNDATGALLVEASFANPVSADGAGAFSTSDDLAHELVAAPPAGKVYRRLTIHNTGLAALFWSADGGTTWIYHPGNFSQTYSLAATVAITAKNVIAGSNIDGCYRSAN